MGEVLGKDRTAAILSALSTVLLAMVLRSSPAMTKTTLWTAAADDRIQRAVEALLNKPEADGTIDRLSGAAGMSRATFLRHFARETGMTVGGFLAPTRRTSRP
ncbi:AraC family transcriptional regulator [Streptomyces sp. NPDC094472]|uniref:AraC family transcriptional regulator n=1 Tax=unclassified Streptomyces TaxID=2593676 RepID=UPI00332420FA